MLATTVWMIFASVIAIRQGLSYQSTARAVGVYAAIQLLLALISRWSCSSRPASPLFLRALPSASGRAP